MQVHIGDILYLQVQNIGYVYLEAKFQNASTHSHFLVLASTENWLCVLEESMNISTQFQNSNFKMQISKFKLQYSSTITKVKSY